MSSHDNAGCRSPKKPPLHAPAWRCFFLTSGPKSAPTALPHSLKHDKVPREQNAILSVQTTHTPRVAAENRGFTFAARARRLEPMRQETAARRVAPPIGECDD